MPTLIVTADDYGYAPPYNDGILEAAVAGAVDAVSAMVDRDACDPGPLLATGVEVGLHLELDPGPDAWTAPDAADGDGDAGAGAEPVCHVDLERAGPRERERARAEIVRQLERFERLFERPPAYLDGHHHAHARPGLGVVVARIARERGLAVRSVDARHRRLLRCQGVPTPDHLVGRLTAAEPALPPELRQGGGGLARGVTEWLCHPGHADPSAGSSYDRAREEDLNLLLSFRVPRGVNRATHRDALGA